MDKQERLRAVSEGMRTLRRIQSEMLAMTQKMQTSLAAYRPGPEDWEDRYVREGFLEAENFANGTDPEA